MEKFKVGDIVRPIKRSRDYTVLVLEIKSYGSFEGRVLESNISDKIRGNEYKSLVTDLFEKLPLTVDDLLAELDKLEKKI